jgi:tetratricopeptide (TPR) repeat protein
VKNGRTVSYFKVNQYLQDYADLSRIHSLENIDKGLPNMKRISKPKKANGKFIALTNKMIINNKRLQVEALSYIKKTGTDDEIVEFISKVTSHPVIGRYMRSYAFPKKMVDLGSYKFSFDQPVELHKQLLWNASLVRNFSDDINKFIQLSLKFEGLILAGNYQGAAEILDYIEENNGYSLWLLENKISLLEATSGLEKEKEWSTKIYKDQKMHLLVRVFTSYFSMRSEKNVSFSWYTSSLEESINNIEEDFKQYCRMKLNFFSNSHYSLISKFAGFDDSFSLIDQYHQFIRTCQYLVCSNHFSIHKQSIVKSLKLLVNKIDDQRLQNLYLMCDINITETISTKSINMIAAFDAYVTGEYAKCVEICEELFKELPSSVDLFEIYVKASFKINRPLLESENLHSRILQLLSEIIQKSNKVNESYQEILKIIAIHSSNQWAVRLYGLANKIYKYENNERTTLENISILSSDPINPALSELCHSRVIFEKIKMNGIISTYSRLYEALHDKNINSLKDLDMPSERLLKNTAYILQGMGNYKEAKECYQKLYTENNDIVVRQEAICGLINCQIETNELEASLRLIIETIFKSPNLYLIIPFEKLFRKVESVGLSPVPISLSIVYDLYAKYNNTIKESYIYDAYEDCLLQKGIERPSEIERVLDDESREQIIYFLKNICVVDIMKYSVVYENLEDVQKERIFVCQFLSRIDTENKNDYLEEIKKYTQQIIIRKGIQQIEENKIHVDTDGIKKSLEKNLNESFNRYLSLQNIKSESEWESNDYITLKSKVSKQKDEILTVMAKNEKEKLFHQMFFELREAFVSSNAYGLDGYLSMGFRHGTLSGQLRSSLLVEHLITPKNNQTNIYHTNDYWNDIYKDNGFQFISRLKEILDTFSKSVDSLINKIINHWIQIKTEEKNEQGMFDFQLFLEEMEELERQVTPKYTFNEFMELAFSKLWSMTDISLIQIKDKIQSEVKNDFTHIFNQLQKGVDKLSESYDLTDIKNSISRARTAIQHDLDRVASWFNRSRKSEVADYELDLPIEIASKIVQYTYPNKHFDLEIKTYKEKKLIGETLNGFVNIFYTLLENAVQRSLLDSVKISIDFLYDNSFITISTENEIAHDLDVKKATEVLDVIRENINTDFSMDKVSKEGGTGLYKVMKVLNVDFRCKSYLSYSFTDRKTFVVTIDIEEGERLFEKSISY